MIAAHWEKDGEQALLAAALIGVKRSANLKVCQCLMSGLKPTAGFYQPRQRADGQTLATLGTSLPIALRRFESRYETATI